MENKGMIVKVGIADLNVVTSPDSLISYALGSCVGICLYDNLAKVAGMSHILLPVSKPGDENLMKYADTAIPLLIKKMEEQKASKFRLKAKIAGGANMFQAFATGNTASIGDRNVEMTKEVLKKLGIQIIAEETGGSTGRTIEFHAEDGILSIKSLSHQIKEI
jgi:Chemotaxis protein; stimulates methylation of MCP proteins